MFREAKIGQAQVVRIDVPGRGGGEAGEGAVRTELEPMIPMLQSGSLFGEPEGLLLMDAQNLHKVESDTLAGLLASADLDSTSVAIVSTGTVGGALSAMVKERGSAVKVGKMYAGDASRWLREEARARSLDLDGQASEALMQRFGTDIASLGHALDQLVEAPGKITGEMILDRFKNRPDEPPWQITAAIEKGDTGTALRRLSDFLVHGHPLVYLAALESDLRRKSLAAAAPDQETMRAWLGKGTDRQMARLWNNRGKVRASSLRKAQEALVRADRLIKTQPEDVHRVTLERLTVAMCRWYG